MFDDAVMFRVISGGCSADAPFSNTLFILDNNNLLKSYNINNKKIFWQIDLSNEISQNNKILQSFITDDEIIIFFNKGIILELNKLNGKILYKQNLKLSEIAFINTYNENFAISLKNGKILFYKQ